MRPLLLLLPLLLLCACEARQPASLPAIPDLELEGMAAPVQEQIQTAERHVRASPEDSEANGRLGMILSAYAMSEQALLLYQRAGILDPSSFRWTYYEALSASDAGLPTEAADALRRALDLDPDHVWARLKLADLMLEGGDPDASRRLYRSVVDEHPDNALAHYGLGRALSLKGEIEGAISQLRAALAVNDKVGDVHYALAQALRQAGQSDAAAHSLRLFERYRNGRLRPADPLILEVAALNRGAGPYITRARYYRQIGRTDAAIAELEGALTIDPKLPDARADLIALYGQTGQAEKARHQYEEARSLGLEGLAMHLEWGRIQRRARDYSGAAETFARALALEPGNVDTLLALGFVREQDGRVEDAIGCYREAIALDPAHREARLRLGGALIARDEYRQAIGMLESALGPKDLLSARILSRLGAAYVGAGSADQARETLERALEIARRTGDVRLATSISQDLAALDRAGDQ
jgi:tetratricopeptide (TPR) repeat protein